MYLEKQIFNFIKGNIYALCWENLLSYGLKHSITRTGIENFHGSSNILFRRLSYSSDDNETKANIAYLKGGPDIISTGPNQKVTTMEIKSRSRMKSLDNHLSSNFEMEQFHKIKTNYPTVRFVYIDTSTLKVNSLSALKQ